MATDLIRYDLLVQDALRGVVRTVLTDAARNGLQGDHHFFITFKTGAPGLRLSDRMRERYPDEMTIILQHQFWDLSVTEHGFEVGLSFSNKPERLLIPFAAITTFHDPSVQFGLKFDLVEGNAGEEGAPTEAPEPVKLPGKRALAAVDSSGSEATKPARLADARAEKASNDKDQKAGESKPKPVLAKVSAEAERGKGDARGEGKGDGEPPKVVSIDAFRKKP